MCYCLQQHQDRELSIKSTILEQEDRIHYQMFTNNCSVVYYKKATKLPSPSCQMTILFQQIPLKIFTSTLGLSFVICFINTLKRDFLFLAHIYFEILDFFGWPHLLKLPTIFEFSCETLLLKSIFFSVFYSIFSEHKSQCLLIFLFIL